MLSHAARGVSACLYYTPYYTGLRATKDTVLPRNRTTGWLVVFLHKRSHSPPATARMMMAITEGDRTSRVLRCQSAADR
jgi:hypothetical protein